MGVKPGYKETEVGVIPIDWEVEPLGKRATFRTGPFGSTLHKSDYTFDGIPVINPMHIIDGKIEPTRSMTITVQAARNLADFRLKPDEVVIGRRGDMGRCAVVQAHQAGWLCGTGSMIIHPRDVDSEFLQRVLSSPRAIGAIQDASVGTTMANINQGTLSGLKIQFPPLEEQRAIATALSDVDALLGGLERLIAKKRDLKQAAMQALLSAPTKAMENGELKMENAANSQLSTLNSPLNIRLPGFHGEWEVKRLGDVLTICHGKSQQDIELADGPYPILATGGQIGTASRPLYGKPSVLIGRKGTINQPQYMDTPFWTVDTLFYSVMKDGNSARYFYYCFCLIDWMQFNEASGVPSLNARTIEHIEIACPESIEQTAIATVLSDMDAELASLEARRDKTRNLKQGMMQELLTGKTRLL